MGHTYLAKSDKAITVFVGLENRQVPRRRSSPTKEAAHSQLTQKSNLVPLVC